MQHANQGAEAQMMRPSALNALLNRMIPGSARGQQLGRAVAGVDPPSVVERLASQAIVTPTQEVIMTGSAGINGCLGGTDEAMIAVKNDIGADQLDISYSFENEESQTAARIVKVASCGSNSVIRQCIPLATTDHLVKLHALAYFYEKVGESSIIREEARIYPVAIDNETLKNTFAVNASDFVSVV